MGATAGAVVSKVYACPGTGTDPPSVFPAASWIVPVVVRFNWIEPLFIPVVPDVEAVTVHVAVGGDADGAALVTVGAVPPRPLVTSPKLVLATFLTGSLNVTRQRNALALVGFASTRMIDETVGSVRSTTHPYDAEPLARPFLSSALTWKLYEPVANGLPTDPYVFGLVQLVNAAAFRLHWKLVAPALLNVRVSVGEFVGLVAGLADSVGVGGALAANAPQAAQPPTVRTPSTVTSLTSLGLRVVFLRIRACHLILSSPFCPRCDFWA